MKSEKKCPNCQQWSSWDESTDATCEHCGAYLSPVERDNKIKKETKEQEDNEKWMFYYPPDAPWYVRITKKTGYVIYTIIMAVVSFIMWLFFWLGP